MDLDLIGLVESRLAGLIDAALGRIATSFSLGKRCTHRLPDDELDSGLVTFTRLPRESIVHVRKNFSGKRPTAKMKFYDVYE